jgi:hypothetical protein
LTKDNIASLNRSNNGGITPEGSSDSLDEDMPAGQSVTTATTKEDRNILSASGLKFKNYLDKLPTELLWQVTNVLQKPRASLASPHGANVVKNAMAAWRLDEAGVVSAHGPNLVPVIEGMHRAEQVQFNDKYLPAVREGFSMPRLKRPRPDQTFGYPTYAEGQGNHAPFNEDEELWIWQDSPAGRVTFPFITMEAKSEAAGGNVFAAEMQCARAGAVMVNYLETFYDTAGLGYDTSDTYHLSVAYTADRALIYVHWSTRQRSIPTYWTQPIIIASLVKQEEAEEFRQVLRNHINWACSVRLAKLKNAVNMATGGKFQSPPSQRKPMASRPTNRFLASPTTSPSPMDRGGKRRGVDLENWGG